jgi:hypothetical protein
VSACPGENSGFRLQNRNKRVAGCQTYVVWSHPDDRAGRLADKPETANIYSYQQLTFFDRYQIC